ncbi:PR domain zinc finger protein 14-like [Asterias rubens]|uniref:PR domain zinc finger protein 14-like n=1 Tax=Asterias rubens TaxID=7604 RepID=UPI001454E66C|nr:PR domain zinc finger protein 14-like [Asterias rubens]
MSTLPLPLSSYLYKWQPARPKTPVSLQNPIGTSTGAPQALFPSPPFPLLGRQCIRVPIPVHQLHHPYQSPLPATAPLIGTPSGREPGQQTVLGVPSAAGSPRVPHHLHNVLPFTGDIHRPPLYSFTSADLDNVLYGYVGASRIRQEPFCGLKCALTDLRFHDTTDRRGGSVFALPPPSDNAGKSDRETLDNERAPSEKTTPRRPSLDIETVSHPEGISITQTVVGGAPHYSVFCQSTMIPKGSRFGPFTGRIINPSEIKNNDDTSFMWEIFHDGKLSHFVDGRNGTSNWLCFVNCARHAKEQNLIASQCGEFIYYEACKDIPRGTELLVWYGDSYRQFMGIPLALKGMTLSKSPAAKEDLQNKEGYKCDRCGKVFSYEDYRDKHLKYTRCVDRGDRKFPCHLCSRSFEKRDRLRIHILHVHQKHRPHKCVTCGKSFSQSSSLNKHMRVHSGERPYKCVYCSKAFTASSILRTHIRQHSGEKPFKCKHCGKAFASHAAHDSHVRRTHAIKDKPCECHVCGKAFSNSNELKYHMNIHSGETQYSCMECGLGFTSAALRDHHSARSECCIKSSQITLL